MRLQTGGFVPRRVTLIAYTSRRVSGCLGGLCANENHKARRLTGRLWLFPPR